MYPIVQSLDGFCSGVGNILSTGAVTTTTMATITTIRVSGLFRVLETEIGN
jgi:hypothetical protein